MKLRRFFVFLCVLTLLSTVCSARSIFYKSVTPAEGFPSHITSIKAVDHGYIWVGTTEGLARVNNNSFKLYTSGEDQTSLPGNHVFSIEEDRNGDIWVLTDAGLAKYDPVMDSFRVYDESKEAPTFSACQLDDCIYFGGSNRLFKYTFADDKLTPVKDFVSTLPFEIDAIYARDESSLYLFNKAQGFLIFNTESGRMTTPQANFTDNYCAFLDSRGRFWRSQYNKGLECYDLRGELLRSYDMSNSDLSSDVILCIAERDGDIWVGTDGGGIGIIDTFSDQVTTLSHGSSQVSTLPDNSIAVIHCSSSGEVWAGRQEGGVLLLMDCYMRSFFVRPSGVKTDNNSDKINCMVSQPRAGAMYLGTHGSGLLRFIPSSESIRNYPATEGFEVVSLANLPGGNLLLSCASKGLYVFNTADGTIQDFPYVDDDLDEWIRFSGRHVNLGTDYKGNILIFSNNVYKYNPYSESFARLDLRGIHDAAHNIIEVKGSGGKYFVCEETISSWDSDTDKVTIELQPPQSTVFYDAAMDSDGIIWVATSDGLGMFSPSTGAFRRIPSPLVESATSVICSGSDKVWVGTNGALFVYLKDKESFVKLDDIDGVYANNFMPKASIQHGDKLYMGGTNGFVMIDPELSFNDVDTPEFVLTDFYVDGSRMPYKHNLGIPFSHKNVELEVFVKEKSVLRNKTYNFRVKTMRGTQEFLSDTPHLQLGSNQVGHHTVSVACTLRDGSWSDFGEVASFKVERPWYLSWYFFLAIILGLGLLLFAIYGINESLSRQRQQTKSTQEHVRFLLNVSHELKTPLTLIINPLKRVIQNTDPDNPDYNRLQNALRQAMRMRTLILTVLSAHKIEEGSATLDASPIDFNTWVRSLAEDFKEEAESRGMRFIQSYDHAISRVDVDTVKLENVLTNILINAFKHSPEYSEIFVGTSLNVRAATVRFFVKDRGPGLGGVDMTKLFSRYYQGVTEKTGSGMGLSYARAIVELHHGEMGAYENTDGAGSTFYFDIPVMQRS